MSKAEQQLMEFARRCNAGTREVCRVSEQMSTIARRDDDADYRDHHGGRKARYGGSKRLNKLMALLRTQGSRNLQNPHEPARDIASETVPNCGRSCRCDHPLTSDKFNKTLHPTSGYVVL